MIGATSEEDEEWKVRLVLQRFCDLGLSLKLSKCEFSKLEVEFLGMIVGCGCIRMDPAKLSAIASWPPPKMVKAIRSLLGFCNFYRKFIPNFSTVAAPLTALTRKTYPWSWSPDQQATFTTLLSLFQQVPVLHLPDVRKPFIVMTDASLLASGGVLMQRDDNSDLHPCAYLSQTFSPAERNYDIYDRELLAIIHTLDHWHHYLQGTEHPVTLLTDHKNLTYFHQLQKLSHCQACWMMFCRILTFTFFMSPALPWAQLMHCPDFPILTLLPTIPMLLFSHWTSLFVPLVSHFSIKSLPLLLMTHWSLMLCVTFRMILLFSLVLPLPIGVSQIPNFISKIVFIFLLQLVMIWFPLFTHRPPLATGASSTLILCCLGTTGGPVCPLSSADLSPGVLFANR